VFETKRMRLLAIAAQLRVQGLLTKLPRQLNASALSSDAPVAAERMSVGPRPTAVQQNVPARLVFGMFFVAASIAGLFVEERACAAWAPDRGN
jgi:ABC-2 type transport system permease protein